MDDTERVQLQNQNRVPIRKVMKDYTCPVIGTSSSSILLDDLSRNYELKNIHFNMLPAFHGIQKANTQKLEVQVGQLVKALQNRAPGKFPSQPEQAKAITVLRSGKIVDNRVGGELSDHSVCDVGTGFDPPVSKEKEVITPDKTPLLHKPATSYVPPVPFSGRL
ncbi:hypothetical protein ACOSQ4_010308 [Xanthoceras sorbifolium]